MNNITIMNVVIKGIEERIDKKFGAQLAFKQVKAALEGKGEKPDPSGLIMDAKAMFSGENKPVLLAVESLAKLQAQVEKRTDTLQEALNKERRVLSDSIEKNVAFLGNRASHISHTVEADEALFAGRLADETGAKPVAGK